MVTVVDPVGTPVPVYNRSGTTVVFLNGGPAMSPTPIPHVAGYTVAIATMSSGNDKVELPSGTEVGDIVEVYLGSANGGDVFAASGDGFTNIGGGNVSLNAAVFFRKVTSTLWAIHKSA